MLSGFPSTNGFETDLGARVRTLRRERGLTLKGLGRLAGLSHPFLSQVERGLARPSVSSVERIAAALDVSVAHLWSPPRQGDAVRVVRSGEGAVAEHTGATYRELPGEPAAPTLREWTASQSPLAGRLGGRARRSRRVRRARLGRGGRQRQRVCAGRGRHAALRRVAPAPHAPCRWHVHARARRHLVTASTPRCRRSAGEAGAPHCANARVCVFVRRGTVHATRGRVHVRTPVVVTTSYSRVPAWRVAAHRAGAPVAPTRARRTAASTRPADARPDGALAVHYGRLANSAGGSPPPSNPFAARLSAAMATPSGPGP